MHRAGWQHPALFLWRHPAPPDPSPRSVLDTGLKSRFAIPSFPPCTVRPSFGSSEVSKVTTIVSVRRNGQGRHRWRWPGFSWQHRRRATPQVHRLYNGKVLAGFAGGTADAFTLLERFEAKLQAHQGNLERAAVALARTGAPIASLRRLEALLAVADEHKSFIITGNGDVVQPEHDLIAIGSGGNFAQSAAIALLENTELDARASSRSPSRFAGDICVFTNGNPPSKYWTTQPNKAASQTPFSGGGPCRPGYRNATMSEMTLREIVHELDRHIIGQADAKRAVAVALRSRWRGCSSPRRCAMK